MADDGIKYPIEIDWGDPSYDIWALTKWDALLVLIVLAVAAFCYAA